MQHHVAEALNGACFALQDAGPNHYWISGTDVPYKFELGGPAHEGCAGIVALTDYLSLMASSGCFDVHFVTHIMLYSKLTYVPVERPD